MRSLLKICSAAALLAPFLVACGGNAEPPPPEYPPVEQPEPTTTVTVEQEPEPAEPAPPPPPPVQVVAGDRTPIEGEAPSLRIRTPRKNQMVRRGNVQVRAQLRNWELGADPGNHVHVIVDNEPYIAVRDLSQPLNLNELVQENLGHELAPGTHVVRMFPSRSHHESVKEGTPFAMVTFHYQERTEDFEFDAEAPLLTYSRPKGCYPAGERILLDFYLTNVEELSEEGHRVRYSIDGQVTGELTDWVPYWIENLQPGEHRIQLTLLGEDGEPVAGPFNDTTRTITVAAGQCPQAAPAEAEEGEEAEGEEGDEE